MIKLKWLAKSKYSALSDNNLECLTNICLQDHKARSFNTLQSNKYICTYQHVDWLIMTNLKDS